MDPRKMLNGAARHALRKVKIPQWTEPMLATLTDTPFSDPDWIYERKLDGVRLLTFKDGDVVRLLSRNDKSENVTFPELVEAMNAQEGTFVVDGEVVTFEGNVTSFSRLQGRIQIKDPDEARGTGIPIWYYLFDILYLGGYDTTGLELRDRKRLLRGAISFDDPLRLLPHRNEIGEALLKEACRKGWEGLIAKDAQSTYVHKRSTDWLKLKCVNQQELVIGGFTDPHGKRVGFGALLLGYYEDGELRYAGKVGTGFDEDTLHEMRSRMESLERTAAPFVAAGEISSKGVHWIAPKLVGEVGFTEWTEDGKLRHPRFLGLRYDKDPKDVVRERPQS